MKRIFTYLSVFAAAAFLFSCNGNRHVAHNADSHTTDSLVYAKGLSITYFDNFTEVSIRDPWDTLKIKKRYILADKEALQKNAAFANSLRKKGILVPVPVNEAVVYTSVHASMMEQIGCIDKIVAVCEPEYITSKEILAKIANGEIADVGMSTSPDIEKIIELNAEIIIASPFENSGYGSAEKLGIPIIEAADYMENHPLARTEWVRFFSLLFGCREKGDSVFFATTDSYNALKKLTKDIPLEKKPTVILERKYGSSWFLPAGGSYIGTLHKDAGANYIYNDIAGAKSRATAFEAVLERASHADFWLMKYSASSPFSYTDLKNEYLPYTYFDAYINRKIFTCNTLKTTYYEDITLHPDRILSDLIHIYYPELLPGYQPRYYFPMTESQK